MTITQERSLTDFNFWMGAADNAAKLTEEELYRLEAILSEQKELWSETELNDLFWFNFETVCRILGLDYDDENDTIRRE